MNCRLMVLEGPEDPGRACFMKRMSVLLKDRLIMTYASDFLGPLA